MHAEPAAGAALKLGQGVVEWLARGGCGGLGAQAQAEARQANGHEQTATLKIGLHKSSIRIGPGTRAPFQGLHSIPDSGRRQGKFKHFAGVGGDRSEHSLDPRQAQVVEIKSRSVPHAVCSAPKAAHRSECGTPVA